jgi:hypothetical protein
LDVSADGSVIVGTGESAAGTEAFIWTTFGGMQSVRDVLIAGGVTGLDDWELTSATGISADGQTLVGFGNNPSGISEAWSATIPLVPEPATWMLAAGGLVGLLGAGYFRRRVAR